MPTPPIMRDAGRDRRKGTPRRTAAALLAVLLAAGAAGALPGCITHERPDSGKPPEGPLRTPPGAAGPAGTRSGGSEKPPAATNVVAVSATGIYHREGCTVLAESPEAQRVPFPSPWTALDAGHTPCSHCRPGP